MSSEGDASPISVTDMQQTFATIPSASFAQFPSESSPAGPATPVSAAPRRPFLKRGSRMPISKLPIDPFTPVVKPIHNPPKVERVQESTVGAHDLERSKVLAEAGPAISSRIPTSNRRPTSSRIPISAPRLQTRETGEWDDIAAKNTEDLESYLRNIGEESDSFYESGHNASQISTVRPNQSLVRQRPIFEESFQPSATLRRQKGAAPPETARDTVDSILYGKSVPAERRPVSAPQDPDVNASRHLEEEMRSKLRELDVQIEKFKKENDYCKKLRLEREAALADAQRYKERALKELEAAEKEIDEQRSQIVTERKRLQQDRDRGRSMVSQLREVQDENKTLKDQIEAMESDFSSKAKRWKNEIVRLNGIVASLDKNKNELEVEVRALANQSSHLNPPILKQVTAPSSADQTLASSLSHPDGRIDRTFTDGRREAVFPSGLRKSVWKDGSALVNFPNGDVKETSATGIVTYRYAATGCVQTTHPDGLEVLEFASGQIESHFPDGSKEIVFPNKMVKRIDANGREQLSHSEM